MGLGAGYPLICGSVIEAASPGWGTAATILNRIPVTKETLTDAVKMIEDMTLRGIAGQDALDLGTIGVTGDIETDIRYTLKSGNYFCGSDLWLSAAMGASPVINASYVSTLFHTPSPNRPVTIVFDKKVSYWEYVSCMLNGFKVSGKTGEALSASFPVVAHRLLRTGTANGSTQFAALAANGGKRVLFDDVVFRIGTLSDALAAGDALGINEFTLDYNSNLSEPEYSTPDYGTTVGAGTHGANTTTQSQRLTLQPARNGKRTCMLDFTLPRYQADTLFTWKALGTELQVDIKTSIDTAARTFSILCPRLKIESVDGNVDSPAMFPVKVKARLLWNGGTSTATLYNDYMTNSVDTTNKIPNEFEIEILNSTDGRTAAIWS